MLRYNIKTGVKKIKTKTALAISGATLGFAGIVMAIAMPLGAKAVTSAAWQLNAPRALTFVCDGSNYEHTLKTVNENPSTGAFTGTGSYNPDTSYTWTTTGSVTGNAVSFAILYTGTSAGSTYSLSGTIAPDGSISGTSDSNCQTFFMPAGSATMASYVIVTPNTAASQGWSTADTRPGGAVTYSTDTTAPGDPHNGALRLTTDATTTAKAQYLHAANTLLSSVNSLSYSTKQDSAAFAGGDASYQLPVCLGGFHDVVTTANPSGCTGFTTFVYEPYENGVVTPSTWQSWDVDAGQFWSSRTASDGGTCNTTAGFGGAPFYTLPVLQASCPNAVVVGFGVNIGSNNPSYNVQADLVNFNGTTYNFEPLVVATDKDQCKSNGWTTLTDANGRSFKNQGDCVSYVATNHKNPANG